MNIKFYTLPLKVGRLIRGMNFCSITFSGWLAFYACGSDDQQVFLRTVNEEFNPDNILFKEYQYFFRVSMDIFRIKNCIDSNFNKV